ncbi:hypothetical protein JCM10212_005474 [Sporobolomyces blumeae]
MGFFGRVAKAPVVVPIESSRDPSTLPPPRLAKPQLAVPLTLPRPGSSHSTESSSSTTVCANPDNEGATRSEGSARRERKTAPTNSSEAEVRRSASGLKAGNDTTRRISGLFRRKSDSKGEVAEGQDVVPPVPTLPQIGFLAISRPDDDAFGLVKEDRDDKVDTDVTSLHRLVQAAANDVSSSVIHLPTVPYGPTRGASPPSRTPALSFSSSASPPSTPTSPVSQPSGLANTRLSYMSRLRTKSAPAADVRSVPSDGSSVPLPGSASARPAWIPRDDSVSSSNRSPTVDVQFQPLAPSTLPPASTSPAAVALLEQRAADLEREVAELKAREVESRRREMAFLRRQREAEEKKQKELENDPRYIEIQKRLAQQKRRSEIMHSKIEARDKPEPSTSASSSRNKSKRTSVRASGDFGSQVSLVAHSHSQPLPPPQLLAVPTPIPFYQLGTFSASAPMLSPSPTMPTIVYGSASPPSPPAMLSYSPPVAPPPRMASPPLALDPRFAQPQPVPVRRATAPLPSGHTLSTSPSSAPKRDPSLLLRPPAPQPVRRATAPNPLPPRRLSVVPPSPPRRVSFLPSVEESPPLASRSPPSSPLRYPEAPSRPVLSASRSTPTLVTFAAVEAASRPMPTPPRPAPEPTPIRRSTTTRRMMPSEPLLKDVRPPAAWHIPDKQGPAVHGRKTDDQVVLSSQG